ncbi:MAG: ABC transporter substrate-binding protein [Actinomycetota bacterium]|nr:ABC transporter substrate-binding protein [Actinomycetota bacterium]
MIDAPGPWGSGPFVLAEGSSSLDTEQAVTSRDPFACTWLQHEDRTPVVRLVANPHYWDKGRGPHVREVVFRNDLTREAALELVCTTEGEVDLVTEVPHAAATRVERSPYARLVAVSPVRALAGVLNRDAEGLPLHDRRARQALNLAVDRATLVREGFAGRARPLAGLTPPTRLTALHRAPERLRPYPYDPARAAALWREATSGRTRPLQLAAMQDWEAAAHRVAGDLHEVLGIDVEVRVLRGEEQLEARRRLAEKSGPQGWDVLLLEQGSQAADTPPLELHRAFVGRTGEFRAGPVLPEFERLYADLVRQRSQVRQVLASNRIDRYVSREALALFLCAPQVLYAVNRHVDFVPYATTFELADTRVSRHHWSRR